MHPVIVAPWAPSSPLAVMAGGVPPISKERGPISGSGDVRVGFPYGPTGAGTDLRNSAQIDCRLRMRYLRGDTRLA